MVAWYTDDELAKEVRHLIEERIPYKEIRLKLQTDHGISIARSTFSDHISRLGWSKDNKSEIEDHADEVEERISKERERLKKTAEHRLLADLTRKEAKQRNLIEALREAAAALPPPTPWKPPASRDSVHGAEHSILLQWSDLHAGKYVDPTLIGERFSYNRTVLEDRVALWQDTIRRITTLHRRAYPIKKLYVFTLGDMIENHLMRPIQRLRIDKEVGTVGRQTIYVGNLIAKTLRDFASEFEQVIFVGVGGNHGRVGKFGEDEPTDNFDWISYKFAEAACRDIPSIRFHIPDTPTALIKLGQKTFFLQHGDAVRSWGESPVNSSVRAARKDAFVQEIFFDYWLCGDKHVSSHTQIGGKSKMYINGNFDGGDGFSVQQLKDACEPSQNLFLYHNDRGIVAHYEVALTEHDLPPAQPVDLT